MRNENGISLVMAIVAGMFLSMIGYVTISTVVTDARNSAKQLQATQTFWLAESGIELTYYWLQNQDPPPSGTDVFSHMAGDKDGIGNLSVTIDPDDRNSTNYLKKYKLLATADVDGVQRQIEVMVEMTTFNRYAYLTGDEGGTIWFTSADLIEGPIHSNDQISIKGSPTFMGKVTSSASSFNQGSPYSPDFQEGYQLDVPPIAFPTASDVTNNYWEMNTDAPFAIDATFGKEASIEFNADGTFTYSVWHWSGFTKVYDIHDASVTISDLNGAIFVDGPVYMEGTLDGEITVVATDDIIITDDLIYEMSDSDGKPLAGCDDMLGLVSNNDVIVADNTANRSDVVINAAILTLGDSFTVEDYRHGSPRGTLTIYGSLSQKVRGPVGTIGYHGIATGYQKDYHYDNRFLDVPPPYYPTTGQYHYVYWKEVAD